MSRGLRGSLHALLLAALLLAPGCAFRAGVRDSRDALSRGDADGALRILADIEIERPGRGAGVLANYDFVRGAALWEVGRDEEARTAFHAALAEDLRAHGALDSRDRTRLAALLSKIEGSERARDAGPAATGGADVAAKDAKGAGKDEAGVDAKPKDEGPSAPKPDPKAGAKDAALAIVIACSGAANTPASIYRGYLSALNAKDVECVLQHTTHAFAEKYREMLEMAIGWIASAEGKVLDEKVDGVAATIVVHEKITISIEGIEHTSERDKTLKLVVEDGTWKLESLDEEGEGDGDSGDGDDDDYGDDGGGDDDPDDPGDGD